MAGKMGRFVPTLTMHIASEAALLRHGMEQTEPQEVAHGVHERKESDTILGMPYCGILNGACRKVSYKPYHMKVGCSIGYVHVIGAVILASITGGRESVQK